MTLDELPARPDDQEMELIADLCREEAEFRKAQVDASIRSTVASFEELCAAVQQRKRPGDRTTDTEIRAIALRARLRCTVIELANSHG